VIYVAAGSGRLPRWSIARALSITFATSEDTAPAPATQRRFRRAKDAGERVSFIRNRFNDLLVPAQAGTQDQTC
jgi:hypothetical protein